MLQAFLVVGGAFVRVQLEPPGGGEQLRDGGARGGEMPPSRQRGQLDSRIDPALGGGHRHFSASRNGSKIGIGTIPVPAPAWSPAWSPGSRWSSVMPRGSG